MAKDYWIFIYLCNGLNVKDLCLLKWKNIDGDWLRYERAKTSRTKKDGKLISVSLKPEAKAIISRWGLPSLSPDSYLFPHLSKGMTPEALGHSGTKTTQNYLAGFEQEAIHKATEALTAFAK
jgi:integrase